MKEQIVEAFEINLEHWIKSRSSAARYMRERVAEHRGRIETTLLDEGKTVQIILWSKEL